METTASRKFNQQFTGIGSHTTRPATAKKIDLDPISKRTINPEYNQIDTKIPQRKVLQPSNVLNHNPITQDTYICNNPINNTIMKRAHTPKVNLESQKIEIPAKRALKACELKNYDYSSQIASLPFGNHERPASNDLSMMPRSNSRTNSSNSCWLMKKMNDFRSELENLPGSFNSRISKDEVYGSKAQNGNRYMMRNTMTSPEVNNNSSNAMILRKKYTPENEKTCIKEVDIRDSKVRQFDEKKHFLEYSHEEMPIIKQELIKGKPRSNYQNAFKSSIQLC